MRVSARSHFEGQEALQNIVKRRGVASHFSENTSGVIKLIVFN